MVKERENLRGELVVQCFVEWLKIALFELDIQKVLVEKEKVQIENS